MFFKWANSSAKLKHTYLTQMFTPVIAGAWCYFFDADPDSALTVVITAVTGSQIGHTGFRAWQNRKVIETTPEAPEAETIIGTTIYLQRGASTDTYTEGRLTYGANACDTIEDAFREQKVKGITRIPAGVYEIKKREELSPLTRKYRDRNLGDWWDWHLELQDVPDFANVYIHIGNTHEDTSGCILVGVKTDDGFISKSKDTYTHFYKWCSDQLSKGKVFISIN